MYVVHTYRFGNYMFTAVAPRAWSRTKQFHIDATKNLGQYNNSDET